MQLGGIEHIARELVKARRVIFTGCGTAWHAGLIGEYLFEDLARIPAETEYASEFRYRNPIIGIRHGGGGHQPVRRDGRHAGRAARGARQGRAGAGHCERRRLDHRPRDRCGRVPARRAGNRRGLDQGLHLPGGGGGADGPVPGPPAVHEPGIHGGDACAAWRPFPTRSPPCWSSPSRFTMWRPSSSTATTGCSWAAATTTRWPWKGP